MKKLLLTTTTLLCAIVISQAQVFTFGPKGGINYTEFTVDEVFTNDGLDYEYITTDPKIGFVGGGFVRLNIENVILQPEILFAQERSELTLSTAGFEDVREIKLNKMDVPLLLGYELGNFVRVQLGPVMTYMKDAEERSTASETWNDFTDNFDDVTWGYQAGIGIDISRLSIDVKYEGAINNLGSQVEIGGQTFNFDHRKNTLQATLGIKLIK